MKKRAEKDFSQVSLTIRLRQLPRKPSRQNPPISMPRNSIPGRRGVAQQCVTAAKALGCQLDRGCLSTTSQRETHGWA